MNYNQFVCQQKFEDGLYAQDEMYDQNIKGQRNKTENEWFTLIPTRYVYWCIYIITKRPS